LQGHFAPAIASLTPLAALCFFWLF